MFPNQKIGIINILNINLILLCISITITNNSYQREFLEKQLQQFLIFCILSSININHSEKNHDLIQECLYDVLGFGCLFLKKRNDLKYKEIIKNFIEPILKEINDELKKSGIKTWFSTKKTLYKNTAVFILFAEDSNKNEKEDKKDEKEFMLSGRFRSTINPLHFATEKSDKRLTIEDSFNMKKKLNISNKKINISFNPNVKELINNIFNVLLTDYKKEKENKRDFVLL